MSHNDSETIKITSEDQYMTRYYEYAMLKNTSKDKEGQVYFLYLFKALDDYAKKQLKKS